MNYKKDYLNKIKKLKEQIRELKQERKALILVHNYQIGEVQDIGDFVGDSLELSFKAAESAAKTILFCGVKFMAETAALLSRNSEVLLPVKEAGCPMADMAEAFEVKKRKYEIGNCIVVTYVNSSVEVKAESDICVTSANALKIVSMIPEDKTILFVPDQNLGAYIKSQLKRDNIILWDGFCPTHARIAPEYITKLKEEHPDACVIIHPEANEDAIELANEVLSTGGMIKFARRTEYKKIIVATEIGIIHRLKKEAPDKYFIPVCEQAICANMKLTNLEDVYSSLKEKKYKINISDQLADRATLPITRMLELSKGNKKVLNEICTKD